MPTEWDEADLALSHSRGGLEESATCGYERLGGYEHLGSSTLGELSDAYKARVLKNGLLFHEPLVAVVARDHARTRRTWLAADDALGWISACEMMPARGRCAASVKERPRDD